MTLAPNLVGDEGNTTQPVQEKYLSELPIRLEKQPRRTIIIEAGIGNEHPRTNGQTVRSPES
ncbi:hypothetical protein V1284_003953 [Nitrobacteraceae bacterium AZCC 2299]|jgi:hypothetical protein